MKHMQLKLSLMTVLLFLSTSVLAQDECLNRYAEKENYDLYYSLYEAGIIDADGIENNCPYFKEEKQVTYRDVALNICRLNPDFINLGDENVCQTEDQEYNDCFNSLIQKRIAYQPPKRKICSNKDALMNKNTLSFMWVRTLMRSLDDDQLSLPLYKRLFKGYNGPELPLDSPRSFGLLRQYYQVLYSVGCGDLPLLDANSDPLDQTYGRSRVTLKDLALYSDRFLTNPDLSCSMAAIDRSEKTWNKESTDTLKSALKSGLEKFSIAQPTREPSRELAGIYTIRFRPTASTCTAQEDLMFLPVGFDNIKIVTDGQTCQATTLDANGARLRNLHGIFSGMSLSCTVYDDGSLFLEGSKFVSNPNDFNASEILFAEIELNESQNTDLLIGNIETTSMGYQSRETLCQETYAAEMDI